MQKALDFVKKYNLFIENGHNLKNPFSWLYGLIAIVNALFPLLMLVNAINYGVFRNPFQFILLFLLLWVIIAALGAYSFLLWWDRKDKVAEYASSNKDEFIITPVVSHLIKTTGEWLGTYIGVAGAIISLIVVIFGGRNIVASLGFTSFANTGVFGIILFPIFGFLIIAVSRFFAEQFRALTSIANNTKKS
ncbi:hypothetical protein [Endomicrobium proavitum]|uniref:Uncharacterized protein n=1 Tax=Endomicrobium proavitum TaxID=1408281 RepID=A0A0G3WJU0_9BACT|nr:hypothetical protein [Endomicrobium proavitum]AKL97764.1 conserved membrane protein of unknown function [Endomicrobium proavitum]